jgi:hypothetical protein
MVMPFSANTKKSLKKAGRFECCELCGARSPCLENNGLQAAHVVSDSSGGQDDADNAIVLCHHCAEVFDRVIKAKIHKALVVSNQHRGTMYAVPSDWPRAEGRRCKGDRV